MITNSTAGNVLLAGDIGGTKTSLALYRNRDSLTEPVAQATIKNKTVQSIEELIEQFLDNKDMQPDAACFGVAGPVRGNRVKMTNLDWTLDGDALKKRFGLNAAVLINDLVATALGAVNLPADNLLTLNSGQADPSGAVAVIAPGTGLGEAFLVKCGESLLPAPSEGGHCSFAPVGDQQRRLLDFMSEHHEYVSTEMVCSGNGIPGLYTFVRAECGQEISPAEKQNSTREIVHDSLAAFEKDDRENCSLMAMELFADILAAEATNLTLKTLATGGLYIGGGIPPRILPFLRPEAFMQVFARGAYRDLLATIPVHVILEPKTALIGAAAYGRQL